MYDKIKNLPEGNQTSHERQVELLQKRVQRYWDEFQEIESTAADIVGRIERLQSEIKDIKSEKEETRNKAKQENLFNSDQN